MSLEGKPLQRPVRVYDLLRRGLDVNPDALAMASSTTRWTWRELEQLSTRLALNLLGLGLSRGDRVASLMPNRSFLLIHYLACIKAGLVAVPLNYRYMAPEVDHALEVSESSLLIAHAERLQDLETSRRAGQLPFGVMSFEAEDTNTTRSLESLLARTTTGGCLGALDQTAPAFVLFTSGSTGKPKGATHTHETLGWMLATAAAAFELENEFTELTGFPIDEGCGMTEVGLAALNPPSGPIKIGSVGRATPGFRFQVRGEDGQELAAGSEGRLWIRANSMTTGYWNRPDATAELFADGWLGSGDIMRADEDGYLWFRGRKKQIIVHDGSNVCKQEVEDALLEHPALESMGVVGVHDAVDGENVVAFVSLRAEARRPDTYEMIEFARQRVGYKAPEDIVVLEQMPLNATGKTDRLALKHLAEHPHEVAP